LSPRYGTWSGRVLYNSQLKNGKYQNLGGAKAEPDISAGPLEDEYVISLRELLQVLWKRLWLIGLVAFVFTGVTVGFTLAQAPEYEASMKMLVGQEQGNTNSGTLQGEVVGLQRIAQTMVEGIRTRPVAEAVVQQLDLQMSPGSLLERLSVEQIRETQFIEASYRDPSPERAQEVVNAVGDIYSKQVSDISPSANAITVTVWERAEVPTVPVSPEPMRNGLLALLLGLVLGAGLALLLEYLDDSWNSPEEVEQISGIPNFGVIPEYEAPKEVR
jgi:capsular polysaccharide biosynthesis protein